MPTKTTPPIRRLRRPSGRWPTRAVALTTKHVIGAGMLALVAGCECPEATTVFPISAEQHRRLSDRYGAEALPDRECEPLCLRPVRESEPPDAGATDAAPGDAGQPDAADGGGGGSGSQPAVGAPTEGFADIAECQLTTVDWVQPAIICTGTLACQR